MVELEDVKFSIIGDPSQAEAAVNKTASSLRSLGSSVSSLGKGLTVGLTAPLLAVGALALKSSADVGGAFNDIRKKTNETGAALAGLKTSFTNVWGNVTSDAKETADALSLIHQQTKLTGTGLEDLTTKFSQLAKITETPLVDVVKTATAAMNAWQIPALSMSDALDGLYAVVGRTGVSITSLASDLTTLKPTLSALGLSFGASASMIGDFEVAGLDASTMQRVFNSLMNTAKKNGTDVTTVFWNLVATLKTAAPGTKAYNDALGDLSGTIGTKLYDAVKRGVFSLKNFQGDILKAPGAIKNAIADTMSFGDVMTLFSHNIEIGMQPLGKAISRVALDAKPQLDAFAGGVRELGKRFSELPPPVQKAIVLTGVFAAQLGPGLVALGNAMPALEKLAIPFSTAGTAATGFASKLAAIPKSLAGLSLGFGTKLVSEPLSGVTSLEGKIKGLGAPIAAASTGLIGWVGHLKDADGATGKIKVGFSGVSSGVGSLRTGMEGVVSKIGAGATGVLGMGASVVGMVPLWAVVAGAVATVGVGLVGAYATSDRFRTLMGELGGVAANFATHLGTAFSKLTSGDWKGALNELKVGLTEAWQGLTKIDWRSAISTIRTQMVEGLTSAWNQFVALVKSVDWGGVADSLKNVFGDAVDFLKGVDWGGVANTIATNIGKAWDAVVAWFRAQNWNSIGQQIGTLIGQALVAAFEASVNFASWFSGALAGLLPDAKTAGASTGKSMGDEAQTGFGAAFAGIGQKLQEQLSRIHIVWKDILGDVGAIFADIGRIAGTGFVLAIEDMLKPLLSFFHIELKTEGVMDKAVNQLKTDLTKYSGDLKTSIKIYADPAKAQADLDLFMKQDRAVLLNPKTDPKTMAIVSAEFAELTKIRQILLDPAVDPATKNAAMVELSIIARDREVINRPNVDPAAKANAEAEITFVSRLREVMMDPNVDEGRRAAAQAILDYIADPREANFNAVANNAEAVDMMLNSIARDRVAAIMVQYHVDTAFPPPGALGEAVPIYKEGGIVKASQGFVTHGRTLVLAGDNPGGMEAFVPLTGGRIPVRLSMPKIPDLSQVRSGGSSGISSPFDMASFVRALTDVLSKVLPKGNVDRRIYVSGVKADEIVSEIQRKNRVNELMYGDY